MLSNFYPYQVWLELDRSPDVIIDRIIKNINTMPADAVTLVVSYEYWSLGDLHRAVDAVKLEFPRRQFLWLLPESIFFQDLVEIDTWDIEYVLIEIDLIQTYFQTEIFKTNKNNNKWNSSADRFLFLTGKPNKTNRVKLLYQMYQQGLLEHAIWSFFTNPELDQQNQKILSTVTPEQYRQFVADCEGSADGETARSQHQSMLVDGTKFDPVIYQQTLFRVISETQMNSQSIISEKTWTTIANHHPFIMAGSVGLLEFLKYKGFETYTEHLLYPDYDQVCDENQRFSQIIDNTWHWLKTIRDSQQVINEQVLHNKQQLDSYIQHNVEQLNYIHSRIGKPNLEIFRLIPGQLGVNEWINFYYGIKDPSWPDCFDEQDFVKLPESIQQECYQNFGYQPKIN